MKPTNLISAYQGLKAIYECTCSEQKVITPYGISSEEAIILGAFCDLLNAQDCPFCIFDGYYIGYSINQISKEFDLLRLSDDMVVNIELKQELSLSDDEKIQKILKQQSKNYYYLKALQRNIFIYSRRKRKIKTAKQISIKLKFCSAVNKEKVYGKEN